jgi:hypothetical protein
MHQTERECLGFKDRGTKIVEGRGGIRGRIREFRG